MVEVVPFKAIHARKIAEQDKSKILAGAFRDSQMRELEKLKYSRTLLYNGEIILVGGAVEQWAGRAEVWAILADNLKYKMLIAHRAVKKFFDELPFNRLEATIVCDFPQAHRWIKALGFKLEAPVMKSYFPNCADGALYAKVRG